MPNTPIDAGSEKLLDGNAKSCEEPPDKPAFYLLTAVAAASISSFNFGYNTGSIAGALLYVKEDIDLSSIHQGFLVSCVLLGAMAGAFLCGPIADKYGRRRTMQFSNTFFILGPIGMALAPGFWVLITARTFTGLGVGIASSLTNLYITELSPAAIRGGLSGVAPFMVTAGILVAYLLSFAFSHLGGTWRWMLGWAVIPAAGQLCLFTFLPETPRWLLTRGRREEALTVLATVRHSTPEQLHSEIENMASELCEQVFQQEAEKGWADVIFAPECRRALVIGLGLNVLQQTVGINIVIYYAPKVLVLAGFSNKSSILLTAGVGFGQLAAMAVLARIVDGVGRRPLAFIGLFGMIVGLLSLAASFLLADLGLLHGLGRGWLAVAGMLIFRVTFSLSLGPLPYIITAEVFPGEYRSAGVSLCWAGNWAFNFVVSLLFLPMMNTITPEGTFAAYTGMCVLAIWFVTVYVPETAGRSLEELNRELSQNSDAN